MIVNKIDKDINNLDQTLREYYAQSNLTLSEFVLFKNIEEVEPYADESIVIERYRDISIKREDLVPFTEIKQKYGWE